MNDKPSWNEDSAFAIACADTPSFIDQNLPESLAESTELSVYLGHGWAPPDEDPEVTKDVYQHQALGIAHEICNCLHEHGFEPDREGDFSRKIGVALDWKRRTLLT